MIASVLISYATLLLSAPPAASVPAEWKSGIKHSFPKTFVAGNEANGTPLYASQCPFKDKGFLVTLTIPAQTLLQALGGKLVNKNLDWQIGKAGTHLHNGMHLSYAGKEYDCKKHFVFAPSKPSQYKWVGGSHGSVPAGAVRGANGSEVQYVCRTSVGGGRHVGKLLPGKACFVGYGGREHAGQGYEVLVKK